jgi:large subunit ribosomal protein L15
MAPELHPPRGARKKKRVAGRGNSSGNGTTAGRGTKGQNARSGGGVREGFEGGQMPLYRRIARRGFSNHPFKVDYVTVNVEELESAYKDGEEVTESSLKERGLVGRKSRYIKVLGNGELKKKLTVRGVKMSGSAARKVEEAGGSVVAEDQGTES